MIPFKNQVEELTRWEKKESRTKKLELNIELLKEDNFCKEEVWKMESQKDAIKVNLERKQEEA